MKEQQLHCKQTKKHRYADQAPENKAAPNILDRQFEQDQPNKVYCTDITYIWAGKKWVYLAAVIDLYSRRVVGWAMSQNPNSDLALEAVKNAFESRGMPQGLMVHSDQGCQYTSHKFVNDLKQNNIVQSMSRRGNCWDNSPMERFFRSFKTEWMSASYESFEHARNDVLTYIYRYNYKRCHTAAQIDHQYLTPANFELQKSAKFFVRNS